MNELNQTSFSLPLALQKMNINGPGHGAKFAVGFMAQAWRGAEIDAGRGRFIIGFNLLFMQT